jgi:hypothetical protein
MVGKSSYMDTIDRDTSKKPTHEHQQVKKKQERPAHDTEMDEEPLHNDRDRGDLPPNTQARSMSKKQKR